MEGLNQSDRETLAVMANDLKHIQSDIKNIRDTMHGTFVTQEKHDALAEKVDRKSVV